MLKIATIPIIACRSVRCVRHIFFSSAWPAHTKKAIPLSQRNCPRSNKSLIDKIIRQQKSSRFCLGNNSLECFRMVHGQISQYLTINFDTCLVQCTHQFRIRHSFQTSSCVDTLNPQCTEITFLVLTVTICVGQSFFPSIFGYSPYVLSCTKITFGKT